MREPYSDWLLAHKAGEHVVDAHGPMRRYLSDAHRRDPNGRLADDGVHINATGDRLMARKILEHWGVRDRGLVDTLGGEQILSADPHKLTALNLVQQKQRLLKAAWPTNTGPQRPGTKPGLPLDEEPRQVRGVGAEMPADRVSPLPQPQR